MRIVPKGSANRPWAKKFFSKILTGEVAPAQFFVLRFTCSAAQSLRERYRSPLDFFILVYLLCKD